MTFAALAAAWASAVLACREPSRATQDNPTAGSAGSAVGAITPAVADAAEPGVPAEPTLARPPIPAPPDLAAPPATAQRLASGVTTSVLTKGSGTRRPKVGDLVTVDYTAWDASGSVFDSSVQRGSPETLPLAAAPRAWREAVEQMTVGEKRRIWIPEDLAAQGRTAARGQLVYDVELVRISSPPAAPSDLARPPSDATRTASGLVYKRLVAGTGKVHPTDANMLTVHYTGWTQDGTMLESTVLYGRPAERTLAAMSTGLAEALRAMVQGDKIRIWMPPALAGSAAGSGDALVVYELELVELR